MRLAAGDRLGPYEILAPLGSGGMGEVYRARDARLGREVAIKVLPTERLADEQRRRRFVQEARAASALNHPNVVTIHEIESSDGIDFIVMELVPGETLDCLIPKQGMRLGEALRVAIPIADALVAAHARGIVHRDLKPANVIVSREGVVKVLDFGLAKVTAGGEDPGESQATESAPAALSRAGAVAGTAGYMSPEQATGGKVDARSDVFSFGTVLYEMVTGRRAFSGKTASETLTAVVREQPKSPRELVSDVPDALERLILRCLRKEPERRFQHMSDLKVELQELKEESDSGAAAPTVPARRKRGLRLAAGLVGALVLVAAGLLYRQARRVEGPAPYLVPLTATTGSEGDPSFSPDGDQIAFAWNGEKKDNWDIYVMAVGSAESHRLTTDPASDDQDPAWSPDGRSIAFVRTPLGSTTGTVHVISPLGGADRRLSDQPVARGPLSWSPDGRWLATAARGGANAVRDDIRGIRLIDASSGEMQPVTTPTGSTFHTGPAFSPDGSRLAYFSCAGAYSCRIEVVELGADSRPKGTARPLTPANIAQAGLTWARDEGSVIYGDFVRGRLQRVRLDGNALPEGIEIAGFYAARPSSAVSRNRLAFVRSGNNGNIYRFEPGRAPEAVAVSSFTDWVPQLSPDGRRLAWASQRAGGGDDIWVAAADGSNPTRLTHGPGLWQSSPRWSPDGRRIAFDSVGEDGQFDVWTIDANGGPPRRLTSDPTNELLPSWSHDGGFVYFSSMRTGTWALWRIPSSGGAEEPVTQEGGGRSQEAPDGRTLYLQRNVRGNSPLLAVPLAGGTERTVVDCVRRFGYAVTVAGIYFVGCDGGAAAPLFLLDPATGRRRQLGTLERAGVGLAVSADGKTILYTKQVGEGSDLVLIENFR